MLFRSRVKLDPRLLKRVRQVAERAGYGSAEEFIERAVEEALARHESSGENDELRRRLRGLGYLS